MKFVRTLIWSTFFVLACNGCGGGGADWMAPTSPVVAEAPSAVTPAAKDQVAATPEAPLTPIATNIQVIGNSLTRHPPLPSIGWSGDWGMAASSQANDFSHVTATRLGLPVTATNFVDLERDSTAATSQIADVVRSITPTTLVIVELGDNAPPAKLSEFDPAYGKLLDAIKGKKLLCLSTWWEVVAKDAIIRRQCESHGGQYVYIGDIYVTPGNPDRLEKQWASSPDIDAHPHDWSMSKIAERVVAAFQ
jgi:hypothetical protein